MEHLQDLFSKINALREEIKKVVVGQENLIDMLFVGLFANGHILLEGAPGLAKTLTIDTFAKALHLEFSRIQFTPDLLPSDLLGAEIYNQAESNFHTKKGPIFANFILADEINRAPSKVQSALLEAMQEKQVTIGDHTYPLPSPFLVLATQNPIEQEGTYNLPEAQLDRFLFKVLVEYPTAEEEIQIMKNILARSTVEINQVMNRKDLEDVMEEVEKVYVDDNIYEYVKDLVFSTRKPADYGLDSLENYISYGASPRASIAFIKAAKVLALMWGRDHVLPEDIKYLAPSILRHRIGLTYEALAENVKTDDIIETLLNSVNVK